MAGPATLYQTGDHAGLPANGSGCVLYTCTDHGKVYRDDGSSWTDFLTLASAGMTNPMTTAEDIIVGGASGTPARLAKGTDGQVLSMVTGAVAWAPAAAGGISSGTSFPGSPTTGDLFHRTNLTPALWRYDGTRWLCTCQHELAMVGGGSLVVDNSTSPVDLARFAPAASAGMDLYLDDFVAYFYVATTNNASHKWVYTLLDLPAGGTIASGDTSAVAANTHSSVTVAIGAVHDISAKPTMLFRTAKSGSPGNLYGNGVLRWRYVAT